MRLWIDDERPAPDWATHVAKTPYEAIDLLSALDEPLEHIAFDHDLGSNGFGGVLEAKTVVRWMHHHGVYPETASIHTSNPWGRKWLEAELADVTTIVATYPGT